MAPLMPLSTPAQEQTELFQQLSYNRMGKLSSEEILPPITVYREIIWHESIPMAYLMLHLTREQGQTILL